MCRTRAERRENMLAGSVSAAVDLYLEQILARWWDDIFWRGGSFPNFGDVSDYFAIMASQEFP